MLILSFVAVFLPACSGPEDDSASDTGAQIETDTDTDADTDTDTDTDSDSDTDTDTDTDTDADTDIGPKFALTLLQDDIAFVRWENVEVTSSGSATLGGSAGAWTNLSGSATIYSTSLDDGAVICDFDVDLASVGGSVSCPNCEFNFAIDSSVTRDASSPDCDQAPELSWLDTAASYDTSMQYIDAYTTHGGYEIPARFQSSYWSPGYEYLYADGTEYSAPPFQRTFVIARVESAGGGASGAGFSASGQVTLAGSALSWDHTETERVRFYAHAHPTCPVFRSTETAALSGQVTRSEALPCDTDIVDVWVLDLVVGDTFSVTVDTVSEPSAFYPALWINSPDACTDVVARNNFPCSFGDDACPTLEWTADESGAWEIVVSNYECGGADGEYTIEVDVY